MQGPGAWLAAARGGLFPWAAVAMAAGIALWFALPWEPGLPVHAALVALGLMAAAAAWRLPDAVAPLAVALACLCAGALVAAVRAHAVAAPMLETRYYGPVTGRIVGIDRSQTDALRLTLDRVVLDGVPPAATPARVRISLRGAEVLHTPRPGEVVMTTAHLAAPEGPVEPGAFDFRRMAYFDRLGAVGYTAAPVLLWQEAEGGERAIDRLRTRMAEAMMQAMPSQAGAFATGAMTGDRSAITAETVAALRDSSLAHLLAISGMNMVFLVAFVFALVRTGLALVPPVALRIDSRKVAAGVGLGVALFYLLLSGANVATERAFVMTAIVLVAVLIDRRALSLRSVALAGMVLMALTPEALLEPGFQMSFAATAALIAAFGALERAVLRERLHPWAIPLFTLVLSSVVAGAATAPFAAAHFNRFAAYGLIANLLTVPVMGAVIMPAGAVAALLCPLGLGAPAYWAMEAGSAWILWVAHWIAALDGAVVAVPAPPAGVIGLAGLALAALVIGPGRWRWAGAAPAMAALALWLALPRPEVLISADGRLVGVLGPEGRALSAPRGAGFAAGNWLQNDGDLAAQAVAAARPGIGPGGRFLLAGRPAAAVRRAEEVAQACAEGRVVILGAPAPAPAPAAAWPAGCAVIGPEVLARTGPVAIAAGGEIRVTRTARRLWSPSPAEDAALAPLAAALAGPPPAGSRLARAGPGRPERGRPSGAANAVCDAKRAPPACP